MANSQYLKDVVEAFIVKWVSNKIAIQLERRKVPVGQTIDGKLVHFEFDGVSQKGEVGLLVSCSQTVKPGGVRKLHVDASILINANFQRRIMAFISDDVRQNFMNKCDGLLPLRHIEMIVCDTLPLEILAEISRFQEAAKSEVGDKGRHWEIGGRRR